MKVRCDWCNKEIEVEKERTFWLCIDKVFCSVKCKEKYLNSKDNGKEA